MKAPVLGRGRTRVDGGPEDPRICVIKITSKTAQYAISRKNMVSSAIEVAKGVVTGETPATNKLRYLSEEELEQVRSGKASATTQA